MLGFFHPNFKQTKTPTNGRGRSGYCFLVNLS